MVDIIVRKDGREERIEADWVKKLGTIALGRWRSPMLPKRGPFTWVGDVVAWFEQCLGHVWKRPIGDPCDRSFPYNHLEALGVEKLKVHKPTMNEGEADPAEPCERKRAKKP
jgi:hypothetical protein